MHRSLLIALAAAAALAFAAPASAHETRSTTVSYADLNLASATDAATMLTRIRASASQVCNFSDMGLGAFDRMVMERDCRRETVAHTIAQLNSPMVTALYTGHHDYVQTAWLR